VAHRKAEGLAELDRLVETAPLDPAIRSYRAVLWARAFPGNLQRALTELDQVRAMGIGGNDILRQRGFIKERLGMLDAAVEDFLAAAEVERNSRRWTGPAAEALASGGRVGYWQHVVTSWTVAGSFEPVARAHIQLGEVDLAFAALERAYEAKDGSLLFLGVDPMYDPIRDDPRFIDLMRRLNLPPAPHSPLNQPARSVADRSARCRPIRTSPPTPKLERA